MVMKNSITGLFKFEVHFP